MSEHDANEISLPMHEHEALTRESLTDIIDQLGRKAFKRALERRHAAPPRRVPAESAPVRTTAS